MPLLPGQVAPPLIVPTLEGRTWSLAGRHVAGTFIYFYRGLRCENSRAAVVELEAKLDNFKALDVEVIAISSDTAEAAHTFASSSGIQHLQVGYALPTEMAIDWGLYLSVPSAQMGDRIYNEPGLFLIRSDGLVQTATTASAPIWRPDIEAVLLEFADRRHALSQVTQTTFVPVVIPAREELSFRNGRGAPPLWQRSD
jgi:peroxiredoxin